jgi:hypothetical protein
MKVFFTILFTVFTLNFFAQIDYKEKFLNEISNEFVDKSFPYYCLSLDRFYIELDNFSIKPMQTDFKTFISDSTLKSIINQYKTDTLTEQWDCKKITKAKCVDVNYENNDLMIISMDYRWSEKKKKKEEIRQTKKYKRKQNKKPKWDKQIFYFSRPLFSSNKEFAIVSVWINSGPMNGSGCIYFFKKINGKWMKLAQTKCMMS